MGTSTPFAGQSGHTPLIPSWLDGGETPPAEPLSDGSDATDGLPIQATAPYPPLPATADPMRFATARDNFSRFARSGGRDTRRLGHALSRYVDSATGGTRAAATRMGAARPASGRLIGFLNDAASRGLTAALRTLDLLSLVGRPVEEVFLGLADYVCPDGGSIDEGIARSAFIETIADLADAGIVDLDGLTADQIQTVFEMYATHAIESRICNDIGAHAVTFPSDPQAAAGVQAQLHDFIQRSVADALTAARTQITALTQDRVLSFVNSVYEEAFRILQMLGEAEAQR